MVLAVSAAFAYPEPGARGGALHPEIVNKAGVSLIFFLHGLLLPFESLKAGLLRWPLHALVQATTFIVFPVALPAVARGNVAAAVLNATLSSVIGVFLTPLWLGLVLGAAGQGLPLADVILDLSRWLLLPLALGQLARPWLGDLARRHK